MCYPLSGCYSPSLLFTVLPPVFDPSCNCSLLRQVLGVAVSGPLVLFLRVGRIAYFSLLYSPPKVRAFVPFALASPTPLWCMERSGQRQSGSCTCSSCNVQMRLAFCRGQRFRTGSSSPALLGPRPRRGPLRIWSGAPEPLHFLLLFCARNCGHSTFFVYGKADPRGESHRHASIAYGMGRACLAQP